MNKQRNHMQDDNQEQQTMVTTTNSIINKSINNTNLLLKPNNKEINENDLNLNTFKINHLNTIIPSEHNDQQLSSESELIAEIKSSNLALIDKRNFASVSNIEASETKDDKIGNNNNNVDSRNNDTNNTVATDDVQCKNNDDDDENGAVNKKESLISSNFTINSGGRTPTARIADSRNRGQQRRANITPLRINYEQCEPADKENMNAEDISFYDGNSPQASPRPCSISPSIDEMGCLSPETSPSRYTVVVEDNGYVTATRQLSNRLDEIDNNSMDSGYSLSQDGTSNERNKTSFKFVEPCGIAPRKIDPSPRKNAHITPPKSTSSFKMYHSLSSSSMESMDEDYMDLFEIESLDDDAQLPTNLNSLISGDIKSLNKTPDSKRPLVRRCLSLVEGNTAKAQARLNFFEPSTPEMFKPISESTISPLIARLSGTVIDSPAQRCFKRPEPPSVSPIRSKRHKAESENFENITDDKENQSISNDFINNCNTIIKRPTFKKSISMNDNIMNALARSSSDPDLIGDFSKPFCLPLTDGRHQDLKSISSDTMAQLLRGDFVESVASFKIIDCRYPYEFEGGHIRGAQNLYTQEQIVEELVKIKTEMATVKEDGPKRHILVFHCEFSSERGPKLSRFLRKHDRTQNSNSYPALHYPEIYLLHGGYKDFYQTYSDLCDPIAYCPMLHPSYGDAYKHFRAKSKSWNGDVRSTCPPNRMVKSRSRLVL